MSILGDLKRQSARHGAILLVLSSLIFVLAVQCWIDRRPKVVFVGQQTLDLAAIIFPGRQPSFAGRLQQTGIRSAIAESVGNSEAGFPRGE